MAGRVLGVSVGLGDGEADSDTLGEAVGVAVGVAVAVSDGVGVGLTGTDGSAVGGGLGVDVALGLGSAVAVTLGDGRAPGDAPLAAAEIGAHPPPRATATATTDAARCPMRARGHRGVRAGPPVPFVVSRKGGSYPDHCDADDEQGQDQRPHEPQVGVVAHPCDGQSAHDDHIGR